MPAKSALVGQFLFESLIINLISLLVAVILVSALMDSFNQLVGLRILSLGIWTEPEVWLVPAGHIPDRRFVGGDLSRFGACRL